MISCQIQLGAIWLCQLPLLSSWLDSLWVIYDRFSWVPSHYTHFWKSGPVGLTGSEWFYARFSCEASDCPHSHYDTIGLTACECFMPSLAECPLMVLSSTLLLWCCWFDSLWVISYQVQLGAFWLCSVSFGLIGSEWLHAGSIWVPSDCPHFYSILLAWQLVSDFMPGPAWCFLTVLTPNLVLLAGQLVSDFMPIQLDALWLVKLLTHPGFVDLTESV